MLGGRRRVLLELFVLTTLVVATTGAPAYAQTTDAPTTQTTAEDDSNGGFDWGEFFEAGAGAAAGAVVGATSAIFVGERTLGQKRDEARTAREDAALQRQLTHLKAVAEAAAKVFGKYLDFTDHRRNDSERRAKAIDTRLAMMDLQAASAFVADPKLDELKSKFLRAVTEGLKESNEKKFDDSNQAVGNAMNELMDFVSKAFGREGVEARSQSSVPVQRAPA